MADIQYFIAPYDSNDFALNSPDLGHDICNGSIIIDEITTHIDELKVIKTKKNMNQLTGYVVCL